MCDDGGGGGGWGRDVVDRSGPRPIRFATTKLLMTGKVYHMYLEGCIIQVLYRENCFIH